MKDCSKEAGFNIPFDAVCEYSPGLTERIEEWRDKQAYLNKKRYKKKEAIIRLIEKGLEE